MAPKIKPKDGDDFYALSIRVRDDDRCWQEWVTIAGSWETLSRRFDLNHVPPNAVLRQGAEARAYLVQALKAELDYQRKTRGGHGQRSN
jgi:hypothetical protein